MNAGLSSLLLLIQPATPTCEMVPPTITVGFPISSKTI